METLLTAKELEEYLHVDRTTVYRMIKDGRLNGIKIGQHWRFNPQEVEILLSGKSNASLSTSKITTDVLPLHCMQPVQDVFAEIAQVGVVTTNTEGEPLTRISNSCDFCKLILGTEKGRKACMQSWKKLADHKKNDPEFHHCHANLAYARAKIQVKGELIAILVTGQFHTEIPSNEEQEQHLKEISKRFDINIDLLKQASQEIKVLDERTVVQIKGWLERVASTFEQISSERADLMDRLKQISNLSEL
ncbi:MAG: PocR ligand-binding domain-containing protein [Anaerolineaceae bacterium]